MTGKGAFPVRTPWLKPYGWTKAITKPLIPGGTEAISDEAFVYFYFGAPPIPGEEYDMPINSADRVWDTSTTTGTGSLTLDGSSPTGYRTFASAFATGTAYIPYCIALQGGTEWETGWGTLSGSTTLARTTVTASSNSGAAVNFSSGTKDVFVTLHKAAFDQRRDRLTAARTYYVRTDGSDSNDGSANTSGAAFLTVQKAVDIVLGTLDLDTYDVTITIAAGTYSDAISVAAPVVGSGRLILNGDTTTPSNVNLTGGITVNGAGARLYIQGVKTSSTALFGSIYVKSGGYLKTTGKNEFGGATVGHRIISEGGATVEAVAAEVISGTAAGGHYQAMNNGYIYCQGATWTASGTAAQGGFAQALTGGVIYAYSNTPSGTFTGPRYSATLNGVIQSNGGGASYFPGNSAGSTATGGQYG